MGQVTRAQQEHGTLKLSTIQARHNKNRALSKHEARHISALKAYGLTMARAHNRLGMTRAHNTTNMHD